MTVKELRKILKAYPKETKVVLRIVNQHMNRELHPSYIHPSYQTPEIVVIEA